MRPKSIVWFDRLYLLAIALVLADGAFSYPSKVKLLAVTSDLGKAGWAPTVLIVTLAVSIGLRLLLWFLISAMASRIAKWLAVILALAALFNVPSLLAAAAVLPMVALPGLLTIALQLVAVFLLLLPGSRRWFAMSARRNPAR